MASSYQDEIAVLQILAAFGETTSAPASPQSANSGLPELVSAREVEVSRLAA